MTNVNKIAELYGMQLHKEQIDSADTHSNTIEAPISATCLVELLDDHLPRTYSPMVISLLKSKGLYLKKYNTDYIRNVRGGRIKNAVVLNAMVAIAGEARNQLNNLRATAKNALAN